MYCVNVLLPNTGRRQNVTCLHARVPCAAKHVPGRRTCACARCPASSLVDGPGCSAPVAPGCISSSCAEADERLDLAVPALNSFYSGCKSNWSPPLVSWIWGVAHSQRQRRVTHSARRVSARGLASGFQWSEADEPPNLAWLGGWVGCGAVVGRPGHKGLLCVIRKVRFPINMKNDSP